MGDSYSTYKGFVPEGYHFYYWTGRTEKPVINGVEKTWWKMLESENNAKIVRNDSYSGSTICNTVRESHTLDSSFVNRIDKYVSEGFFLKNHVDSFLIFGGTNDSWINSPVGECKYSDWTEEDLKSVLPAFGYLLSKAKSVCDNVTVIINTGLKPEIVSGFTDACERFNVKYALLKDIDKQNGHPTEAGMRQITDQVCAII